MKIRPTQAHARFASLAIASLFVLACATPSTDSIRKTLEDNPDIVFNAIEKNPDKFMATLQKAAESQRAKGREDQEREERERVENELKNPLKPEIAADRAFKGAANAPVTIVEYTDFQCPFCARGNQTIQRVMKEYAGKVKLVYKSLPLPMHSLAMPAAIRFEAIALQSSDKAYKFHDEVFAAQSKLNNGGEKTLDALAKKVGADVAQMKKDMNSEKIKALVAADMAEAERFGITGTPGFIVGGVSVRGAYPFETFKEIIDKKLAMAK